jgi:hypothetical protein
VKNYGLLFHATLEVMMLLVGILATLLLIAGYVIVVFAMRAHHFGSKHRALEQEQTATKERLQLIELEVSAAKEQAQSVGTENTALKERFKSVLDMEAEKQRVLAGLEIERLRLQAEISRLQGEQAQSLLLLQEHLEAEKQRALAGLEAERLRLTAEIAHLQGEQGQARLFLQEQKTRGESEMQAIQSNIARLREEFNALDEAANLQSFGYYKPRYGFDSSSRYQTTLDYIRERQKEMIKLKTAAVCHIEWTVNGSRTEGRKQINQTLKLILRAFNGESDAAIAKVKYSNLDVMEARIRKAWEMINSMVQVQQCRIAEAYLNFKLEELLLVHEYQEKQQDEKEEQRRIREQMREEEIAQRELEKARQEAEREEKRYAEALRKAREEVENAVGEKQKKLLGQIDELEKKLEEAQANKERAIARAQMTRSGHVYIISNIGSFGDDVFKIGMTRRLDPMDRVRELSGASVPFLFDVHAVIYSEDAPTLENTLHRAFHHRRVNRVNERKEFFSVTLDEIAEAVRQHHGAIEFIHMAEAKEYRQSLAILRTAGSASSVPADATEQPMLHPNAS